MSDVATYVAAVDALVAARVRACREARRLTQPELAARIGVSFQQVYKYERGLNRISAGRLAAIARALDVAVADLLASHDAGGGAEEVVPVRSGSP